MPFNLSLMPFTMRTPAVKTESRNEISINMIYTKAQHIHAHWLEVLVLCAEQCSIQQVQQVKNESYRKNEALWKLLSHTER